MCCFSVALAFTARAQWHHFSSTMPGNSPPESAAALPQDMLEAHNQVRARIEVPPLRWSNRLAGYAQDWAGRLLQEGQFRHRPHPLFGENLFEINGGHASPTQVIGVWASEAGDYNHALNTCSGVCGHYTQLVWRETREVGCAVARDASQEVWVCNYDPPGNWVGERPY